MTARRLSILALATLAAAACTSKPASKPNGAPGAESASSDARRAPEATAAKAEALPKWLGLEVTPFDEEFQTTSVEYRGEPTELALRKSPTNASPVTGTVELADGIDLAWVDAITNVLEPSTYTAKAALTYSGYSLVTDEGIMADTSNSHAFAPGDAMHLFHYAGEGDCYVGFESTQGYVKAVGTCPGTEQWVLAEGIEGKPKSAELWILLTPEGRATVDTGWLHVTVPPFTLGAQSIEELE